MNDKRYKPGWKKSHPVPTAGGTQCLVNRINAKGYPASCVVRKGQVVPAHVRFGPEVLPDHVSALRMLFPELTHCTLLVDIPAEPGTSIYV